MHLRKQQQIYWSLPLDPNRDLNDVVLLFPWSPSFIKILIVCNNVCFPFAHVFIGNPHGHNMLYLSFPIKC